MGDLSVEPSMEEILSSIKRIIAEEEGAPAARRRPLRAAPHPLADSPPEDEVLELSDPMPPTQPPASAASPAPGPAAPQPVQPEMPTPRIAEQAAAPSDSRPAASPTEARPGVTPDPILSARAVDATRGSLETLSRLMVKPEPQSDGTLEGLVRDMLRPMLREWLDANLPHMVEEMVSREIARISGQTR